MKKGAITSAALVGAELVGTACHRVPVWPPPWLRTADSAPPTPPVPDEQTARPGPPPASEGAAAALTALTAPEAAPEAPAAEEAAPTAPEAAAALMADCKACRRPLDAKGRCWRCCNRPCVECGRMTGSALIARCVPCGLKFNGNAGDPL